MSLDFENDIFISYSHIDDEPLPEEDKGWVTYLHFYLDNRLAQLLGEEPKIWRDPKLRGNEVFAKSIVEKFSKVAILISILSPRYAKSEWCKKELDGFIHAAEKAGGAKSEECDRLFIVEKTPYPIEELPENLRTIIEDRLAYRFYEIGPDERILEFNKTFGQESEREKALLLNELVNDICENLKTLKGQKTDWGIHADSPDGFTIYLAETTLDVEPNRNKVKRELQKRGFKILPDKPLPLYEPDLESAILKYLEQCQLSIHMFGQRYGIVPEGSRSSLNENQLEVATEFAAKNQLPRIIWMPEHLRNIDERQQQFLETIRNDSKILNNAELLQDSIENLKTYIEEKIDSLKQEETIIETESGGFIYLICHQNDLDQAKLIKDELVKQGYDVILPLFEGSTAEIREGHETYLSICDAVLILYGTGNEPWVWTKIKDLDKNLARRSDPVKAKAVYIGAPATEKKKEFFTNKAIIIQSDDGDSPAKTLTPFTSELKKQVKP